jgi:undecaprenyl-diphosphatase
MDSIVVFVASYGLFFSLAIAVYVWLRLPREQKWEFVVWAVIGGAIAVALVKIGGALYFDTRPFVTDHVAPLIAHAPDNGFPSDHTAASMFAALLVLYYSRRWGVVLVVISLLIGASRIDAHLHRPTDVLGAIGIAAISALIAFPAARRLTRRRPHGARKAAV